MLPPTVQPVSLREIAEKLNGTLVGNEALQVNRLTHPAMAQRETDLALAIEPDALAKLTQSPVKAAILLESMAPQEGQLEGYITVKRPRYAMATLLEIFNTPVHRYQGIHPSAVVEASAQVAEGVSIGAFAYVGEEAVIGQGTIVMPHVTVGAQARIGKDCLLHPGARVGERVVLGNRVILQQNASIGADGFSYVTPEKGSIESARESGRIEAENTEIIRINSIGTVVLEDEVEIGACATVDRATMGVTLVKRGTKIDNLVMVGHNNTIGENCLIVAQVGVAGSCKIGDRVVIAGQAGMKDHITIGNDAIVMAQAGIMWDIAPKTVVVGSPAMPQREAFQQMALVGKLKEMRQDLMTLKKRLAELEEQALLREGAPVVG